MGNSDSPTAVTGAESAQRAVEVALEQFSQFGFTETKMETIANLSGLSKRMLHYHFGDKRGLYQRALEAAVERLNPPLEDLEVDSEVPVEGVRKLVDTLFACHIAHPEAVRMLAMETSQQVFGVVGRQPVNDVSGVALHLDKLLLHGQDSGAFRPGISADDIFTLITSLTMYRVTNHNMIDNLLGIDMQSEANTAGLHRMVVDAVLAFLTANIPDSGEASYLTAREAVDTADNNSDIYG